MKITGTHVTVALGLVGLGVTYYVGKKALDAAGKVGAGVADAVSYGVQQITPWNPDNVFASAVNKAGAAVVPQDGPGRNADGSWTLGGFVFDVQNLGGLNGFALVSPPSAAAQLTVTGIKKLGEMLPGELKTTAADWAQPTQYDALGNVIQ